MNIALDFINTLLRNMGSEAKALKAEAPEGEVFEGVYPKIEITGDRSGILIGHHGERLTQFSSSQIFVLIVRRVHQDVNLLKLL